MSSLKICDALPKAVSCYSYVRHLCPHASVTYHSGTRTHALSETDHWLEDWNHHFCLTLIKVLPCWDGAGLGPRKIKAAGRTWVIELIQSFVGKEGCCWMGSQQCLHHQSLYFLPILEAKSDYLIFLFVFFLTQAFSSLFLGYFYFFLYALPVYVHVLFFLLVYWFFLLICKGSLIIIIFF